MNATISFGIRKAAVFTLAFFIMLLHSGCLGMMMPENAGTGGTPPATSTISIESSGFAPASSTVSVGTTVIWVNKDSGEHTVTSNTGAFGSGVLGTNGTYAFKFVNPGTYLYHCSLHPSMSATIFVN